MTNTQKNNLLYLLAGLGLSSILWVLFKTIYLNPYFVFDSYYYIYAALVNADAGAWPIGYSKFLGLIGLFSHSANLLVSIQYFFLQFCLLFFFLSLRYFFRLRKWASLSLFVLLLVNPIYIYTCNFVLSDALFLGLSLVWLINLLWILFQPQPWLILTQALLLLFLFSIRQSALIYPVIAGIAFLLSRQKLWLKIAGIVLPCILVGGFIIYTTHVNKVNYGVKQFSPFQSWKVASNALYAYEHVPARKVQPVPASFKPLDSLVQRYFHSRHQPVGLLHQDPSTGSYYMFMYPSPLLTYKDLQCGYDRHFLINIKTLSKMGPLYDAYGSYLIKKYPWTYFRYFVLPATYTYMIPYSEVYNQGEALFVRQWDTLIQMKKKWFGNISSYEPVRYENIRRSLFDYYPIINTLTHLIFILTFLGFLWLNGYKHLASPYRKALGLIAVLWLANFFFMVIASASLLRYQLFITTVELAFATFFIDFIAGSENKSHPLYNSL